MELLTKELIQELLAADQEPCLSLYMPTHRMHPENLKDVILFKNLVRQMKESLLQKYSAGEVKAHLEPFEILADDESIWNHTNEGLAVFSTTGLFKVVGVHISFEELALVADSFHTKPLRQYLQSLDHFYVLGLTLGDIQLFEGTRHTLTEVDLTADTPKNITDALYNELTSNQPSISSFSGRKDDTENETEKYFRDIANTVYEQYSKPSGWPLILAALTEHQSLFQQVNKSPLLLPNGITINPTSVSVEKLASMAWEIMEPEYHLKLDKVAALFEQAKANGKGSDDYKEVAVAAVEGRVETLLVEADRIIPVRITNLVTGNTQKKDLINPKVDDLLDDMGELVMKMGGQVMVLPTAKMPSETGLAAIFRY